MPDRRVKDQPTQDDYGPAGGFNFSSLELNIGKNHSPRAKPCLVEHFPVLRGEYGRDDPNRQDHHSRRKLGHNQDLGSTVFGGDP